MENLGFLKYFTDALGFPVPLGVCILVSVLFTFMFIRLQSNRRRDYDSVLEGYKELNFSLQKTIDAKENRIRELELRMERLCTKSDGG